MATLVRGEHAAKLVTLQRQRRIVDARDRLAGRNVAADFSNPGQPARDLRRDTGVVAADHRARHLDAGGEFRDLRFRDAHCGGGAPWAPATPGASSSTIGMNLKNLASK